MDTAVTAVDARSFGPLQEPDRLKSLDVLRGFALLGIFMVNMQFFAMPVMYALDDPTLPDAPLSHQLCWGLVKALCEFKFISMFSLLFGAGLIMQMNRADAAGRPFVPVYLRRLAVLFLIGFVHAFGMWYGDILLLYSILALVLLLCRKLRPLPLAIIAGSVLGFSMLLSLGSAGMQVAFEKFAEDRYATTQPTENAFESDSQLIGWQAIRESGGDPNSPAWVTGEMAAYKHGPLLDALLFRAITYTFAFAQAAFGYGWHVLAMFFAGAALMKWNFFYADARVWHRRLALGGLALGLPLELLSAWLWFLASSGDHISWTLILAIPMHDLGGAVLCLGYVGALSALVCSGYLSTLTSAIARVGRMALTNYLLQTLIATFLMYWWGLAWFNEVTRPQQITLVLVIYCCQVVLSTLWLQFFSVGPAEWLWRSLTYLKLQPVRR